MKCEKFEKMISDKMDGKLSARNEHVLNNHMEKCSSCRSYSQSLYRIHEEIGSSKYENVDPYYWREFVPRLKTKLSSVKLEKRGLSLFALKWKWALTGAGLIFVMALGFVLFVFQHKSATENYIFSFEDSFERLYQEIGNNTSVENSFNSVIVSSIDENFKEAILENRPDFYENPFFWEGLTEEEMKFLESEIKKEIKFSEASYEK